MSSLIIATGSNLGDRKGHLLQAQVLLQQDFQLVAASRIYVSPAVDYEQQPDFYNQVLEFELPSLSAITVMQQLLALEQRLGRIRDIPRGPRIIDLDMLFWGLQSINTEQLIIPHPRWSERSFVVRPLQELPFFQTIEKCFTIPASFEVEARPLE
jgi:2-amino-4-hydroxy-6-hydroxymethyldihydropteridine diphosphokinase